MANGKRPDRQSGRASRAFLRFIEEHGIALRERAGLGPEGPLDPFAAASQFGIIVGNLSSLPALDQHDIQRLREISPRTWSGGAQELPDGRLHVLLNPNQTPERGHNSDGGGGACLLRTSTDITGVGTDRANRPDV